MHLPDMDIIQLLFRNRVNTRPPGGTFGLSITRQMHIGKLSRLSFQAVVDDESTHHPSFRPSAKDMNLPQKSRRYPAHAATETLRFTNSREPPIRFSSGYKDASPYKDPIHTRKDFTRAIIESHPSCKKSKVAHWEIDEILSSSPQRKIDHGWDHSIGDTSQFGTHIKIPIDP